MTNELTEVPATGLQRIAPMPVAELRLQLDAIQKYVKDLLVEGVDFMKIPRCPKPSLLQPGAEKIALGFNLGRRTNITTTDLGSDHREYVARVTLYNRATGLEVGEGIGECSTMEAKYRYFKDKSERQDLASEWHTCMVMAEKRAFVNATKCLAAVSGRFTMDMEDKGHDSAAKAAPTGGGEPPKGSISEAQKKRALYIGKDAGLEFKEVEKACKALHGCPVSHLPWQQYKDFCDLLADAGATRTAIADRAAPATEATPPPEGEIDAFLEGATTVLEGEPPPRDDEAPPDEW